MMHIMRRRIECRSRVAAEDNLTNQDVARTMLVPRLPGVRGRQRRKGFGRPSNPQLDIVPMDPQMLVMDGSSRDGGNPRARGLLRPGAPGTAGHPPSDRCAHRQRA
jgi:hypothetical protein